MYKRKTKLDRYFEMWKRAFDFRGLCSLSEYRGALLIHILVIVAISLIAFFWNSLVTISLIGFYAIISLIPFTAMSIRRFHDAGWSGWWTVLVYFGIGVLLCASLTFTSALALRSLRPSDFEEIYGPPPVSDAMMPGDFEFVYGPPPEAFGAVEEVGEPSIE